MARILLNLLALGAVSFTALSFTSPAKAQQYSVNEQSTNQTNWYGLGIGALLIGGISAYGTWLIFDTRYQRLKNSIDDKIHSADLERSEAVRTTKATTETIRKLNEQLNQYKLTVDELSNKLNAEITAKFILTNNNQINIDKANSEIERLKLELQFIQKIKEELNLKVEHLETDVETLHQEFEKNLQLKFDDELEICVERETEYLCELTEKAFALMKEFDDWYQVIRKHHEEQRETALNLGDEYVNNLNRIITTADNSAAAHQEALNEAHAEIQRLRVKEHGVLIEPIKSGKDGSYYPMTDYFIDDLFVRYRIPLKFLGIDIKEDNALVSVGYSINADVDFIIQHLKSSFQRWIKERGIHSIEDVKAEKLYPAITFRIRRDAPIKDEKSVYRSQDDFKKLIANSRIFYRIMGKPESGKSPTALIIIDTILKAGGMKEFNTPKGRLLPHTIFKFCNPIDFSNKTSSDFEVFQEWDNFDKSFVDLWQEYNFRRDKKNFHYKDRTGYVWVCDEFDNGVRNSDLYDVKKLQSITSDGGHANIGAIVLGQGVNVSKAKIQGEDIKMFLNIAIDPISIRNFFDKYGELVYSKATIAEALTTLTELEKLAESKNRTIVDTARKFRFCMITEDRSPVFYQLPYFDEYDFDYSALEETREAVESLKMSTNTQNTVFSNSLRESEIESKNVSLEANVECPECGSSNTIKNGWYKDLRKMICKDCGHNFKVDETIPNSN